MGWAATSSSLPCAGSHFHAMNAPNTMNAAATGYVMRIASTNAWRDSSISAAPCFAGSVLA